MRSVIGFGAVLLLSLSFFGVQAQEKADQSYVNMLDENKRPVASTAESLDSKLEAPQRNDGSAQEKKRVRAILISVPQEQALLKPISR